MSDTYEIEIKSLLGEEKNADSLREKLREIDPTLEASSSYSQVNHYFEGGDLHTLSQALRKYLNDDSIKKIELIAKKGSHVSIRSREMNGQARMVVKASIGEDSSSNGVARLEVEEPVACSLSVLDELILSCGYSYQAKWSRKREEYKLGDITVCLDKNAGYGYLAEFEKVVTNPEDAEKTKNELYAFMERLGVTELSQERIERMFAYYNEHWPDYYGTDKVFVIE